MGSLIFYLYLTLRQIVMKMIFRKLGNNIKKIKTINNNDNKLFYII